MMEIALFAFCALSLSAATGSLGFAIAQYQALKADEKDRAALKAELSDMLKKFTDEHNKLVYQVAELHDKMGILDMKVSGVGGKAPMARKF